MISSMPRKNRKKCCNKVRWSVSFRHDYRSLISLQIPVELWLLNFAFHRLCMKNQFYADNRQHMYTKIRVKNRKEHRSGLEWANARVFIVIKCSMWKTNSDKMHQLRISTCLLTVCTVFSQLSLSLSFRLSAYLLNLIFLATVTAWSAKLYKFFHLQMAILRIHILEMHRIARKCAKSTWHT